MGPGFPAALEDSETSFVAHGEPTQAAAAASADHESRPSQLNLRSAAGVSSCGAQLVVHGWPPGAPVPDTGGVDDVRDIL